MFNKNLNIAGNNEVYVIDMGAALQPTVSIAHSTKVSWMLYTNVLMPTVNTIDLTVLEHEALAKELASAIQRAYGSGVWQDELTKDNILSLKLEGLHKLQNGIDKEFFQDDASFSMLLDMQDRFLASAVKMMQLAREGFVEDAYALLTGSYARTSRQMVWLLKNLKRRMRIESPV
jgi:hypothetical protein